MALVLDDRVQETTTTTGTGTLTLAGAVLGYQSFAAIGNGNTTYYCITDGTNWETGIGTYTSSGTTLARTTVLESSNSGSLVNFSAGTKNVFVTYPAAKSVYTDSPSSFGFKNRIINGQMQIAQRATSGTSGAAVPTTAPTYPSVDRFYAYATGATVTVAQVAGSNSTKNNLQVTGAASVTAVGIGQRIEQLNCYDMAGSTATLSVNISNSLLTTVTWTANYATSADTWSAKTQIATGTFTVTSTLKNYSVQISIPAAATTGIEILFTVGAQTSGTWVIGNVQLEKGSVATAFDYRSYGTEFQLCQRYYEQTNIVNGHYLGVGMAWTTTDCRIVLQHQVPKRAASTSTFSGTLRVGTSAVSKTITSFLFDTPSANSVLMYNQSQTGLTIGQAYQFQGPISGNTTITFSSEL